MFNTKIQYHKQSVTSLQSKKNSKSSSQIGDSTVTVYGNENTGTTGVGKISKKMKQNHAFTACHSPVGISTQNIWIKHWAKPFTAACAKVNGDASKTLEKKKKKWELKWETSDNDNHIEHVISLNTKQKTETENSEKELLRQASDRSINEDMLYKNEQITLCKYIKQYYHETKEYQETKLNYYKYGRWIGRGAFGKVNIAWHVSSGRLVAIKSFNKSKLKGNKAIQKINHEIEILKQLKHPFISQILDSFETEDYIWIVLEYICGDWLEFMRKRAKISENMAKLIFKQIIEGLKFIHMNKIVHRDIKWDNILIDLTNTIKICDFGVSRKLHSGDLMKDHCGTLTYIAPEILKNKGYKGYSCDIWSAGVTLYYMWSGTQPFEGKTVKEIEKNIMWGEYNKIEGISVEAQNWIESMMQVDPKKRWTVDQILYHPWLINVNLRERRSANIFTKTEKILLSKFDVNYHSSPKEKLVENFSLSNLNTKDEDKQYGHTKSLILAPYNSINNTPTSRLIQGIEWNNNMCQFEGKVHYANIKYEWNNNSDFDNGAMITENKSIPSLNSKNNNSSDFMYTSPQVERNFSQWQSKWQSPNKNISGDIEEERRKYYVFNEKIIEYIEENVGFDREFVLKSLNNKEVNYATATYFWLLETLNSRNDE